MICSWNALSIIFSLLSHDRHVSLDSIVIELTCFPLHWKATHRCNLLSSMATLVEKSFRLISIQLFWLFFVTFYKIMRFILPQLETKSSIMNLIMYQLTANRVFWPQTHRKKATCRHQIVKSLFFFFASFFFLLHFFSTSFSRTQHSIHEMSDIHDDLRCGAMEMNSFGPSPTHSIITLQNKWELMVQRKVASA